MSKEDYFASGGFFRDQVKKEKKDYIKKYIIPVVLTAILTTAGFYIVESSFRESSVDLTTAGEIQEDKAVLKLYNNAEKHSASDIIFYGLIDTEFKPVKRLLGEIIYPGREYILEIPLTKENVIIEFNNSNGQTMDNLKQVLPSIIPKLDGYNVLAYKVFCENCANTDQINYILVNFTQTFKVECNEVFSDKCEVVYQRYKWRI